MELLKTSWHFVRNQRINVKMIPVKAFGSFLNLGTNICFPYLTLQMLNIGLNFNDVSIIYGLIPIASFLTSPISGQFL